MKFDTILFIIFCVPLLIIGLKKDKLIEKNYFYKCLILSVYMIVLGIIYDYYNDDNNVRCSSYFGSQLLFIFLIMNKILRNIYFKIYKREPEFGNLPEYKVDYIYSFIIIISMMVLPFIIDEFIVKKIIIYVN